MGGLWDAGILSLLQSIQFARAIAGWAGDEYGNLRLSSNSTGLFQSERAQLTQNLLQGFSDSNRRYFDFGNTSAPTGVTGKGKGAKYSQETGTGLMIVSGCYLIRL